MNKVLATAALLFYLYLVQARAVHEEPRCSKYEFEEKVLEKVIRFEHKMELLTDSVEKIAAKVTDNLNSVQKDLEKHKSDQTNALNQLAENIRTEWKEIKTGFGLLKQNMEEQGSTMNGTIYSQLNSFKKSFDDLAAQIQQPSFPFSAHDLSTAKPLHGDILVFTKTRFNQDGLYSAATGKYTAPADGTYVFHATLNSNANGKSIHVEIKADTVAIGKFVVYDKSYDISSSGSAVARLDKGTEVYLRVTSVYEGYGFRDDAYYMNTFSGYRISR